MINDFDLRKFETKPKINKKLLNALLHNVIHNKVCKNITNMNHNYEKIQIDFY